jgi:Caspase domain/PilZ domain
MPQRLALLVGINDYGDSSGLTPLSYAEADVDLLSAVLSEKGRFTTTVLKGKAATHDGVVRALRKFYEQEDLGLFLLFFAGHGEMLSEIGKFSLHCFGSEAQDTIGTLTLSEVAQRVRDKVPAPTAVLIVDACRSRMFRGPQRRGPDEGLAAAAIADIRQISELLPRFWEPESVLLPQEQFLVTFLSCGVGQYSYEDSTLGHGIFTYGLVQELRGCRGPIPLGSLRKRVGDFTRAYCIDRRLAPVQIPEWVEPSVSGEVYLGEEPTRRAVSSTSGSVSERRSALRFIMTLPAKIKLVHSPENIFSVRVRDISYLGMFLESRYPIVEGQEISMDLCLPAQIALAVDIHIHVLGTILRVDREKDKWLAAVRITDYKFIPTKKLGSDQIGDAVTP